MVHASEIPTNRLIGEKSPYLLQHAHNPVDWYAWGREAFEKARKEDKPVFLSIGYSTCHWCHVMEEESFENKDIAQILNENFVSIKVDREERPDIDNIYMQAVMAMTGSGGWPMSLFMTAEGKPFYGGTYFPPADRWGRPGFASILRTLAQDWKNKRQSLLERGDELTKALRVSRKDSASKDILSVEILQKGADQFNAQFDFDYGGFGDAPKFPRAHTLSFLLRWWKRTGDTNALEMVEKTLTEMARGGIYDQLGGGFHRYSTDRVWRIPHFEKMLYDQAILGRSYAEAYQATRKEEYAKIARGIFDYVLREMTDSSGGFYSAADADSAPDPAHPKKKSEGAFFLWTREEILTVLGKEEGQIFIYAFGVLPEGNAVTDPHHEFERKNVLYAAHCVEEAARKFKKSNEQIEGILKEAKTILSGIRSKRPRPHWDDKILTDWNGLMISALAFGGRALDESRYVQAAKKAADFILGQMRNKDGRLLHRFRENEAAIPAFLDDYAFLGNGLTELYEATFDPHYLEEAKALMAAMIRLFWDEETGGFYFTAVDGEKLIIQTKELYDGAVPSGNSVAALLLLRVGRLTFDREMENRSRQVMAAFSKDIDYFPSGFPQMLTALDFAIGPSREIVIAGEPGGLALEKIRRMIDAGFYPNQVVLLHPSKGEAAKKIESLAPFVKNQIALNGKPTVYVCKNYVCDLPVTDMSKLEALLDKD